MQLLTCRAILILIPICFFFACDRDKKQDDKPVQQENAATAYLGKTRYTVGDSVRVGFAKKITDVDVRWNGAGKEVVKNLADTILLDTRGQKTGWHQLIVKSRSEQNEEYTDTLRVELVSDLAPVEIKFTVLSSFPHQTTSFTEGLEFYKGELYEGTGQNGSSNLLKIDLKTGATLKAVPLQAKYFGEGITIVNDKIYQLTWQSGVCFRYNMDFKLEKTFTYYTQGWGMTHSDNTLIMSDGSSKLHFYNTEMEKTGEVDVYDQKGPVRQLNELEYVDGFVFANIFESTKIVKIDPKTGKIVGFMEMKSVVPASINVSKDVLNGIAYQPFEKALYVTGKNWPSLFKIKLNDTAKSRLAAR